jgi:hypothetical protein
MSDDEIVIREVTEGIWTFSKPFKRFGIFPWGGRSTAVKLANGDVWVLASTPLSSETKKTLDKLGPVAYIVAPDAGHHLYLGQFKSAYPDAKLIGVADLVEKKKKEGLTLDGAYGRDPADTKYGYEPEIEAIYFSGFSMKDVAFLHAPSKTLIQADLLFNLPGNEQYSKSKTSPKLPIIGSFQPFGKIHKHFLWGEGKDKAAMKKDAIAVANWDFDRVIMCHGDVIETGGNAAWREAYKWYIEGK